MRLTSPHTLRGFMDQKGFTQTRLARYAGLKDHSFISHLLRGKKTTCTPAVAQLIAEALDVPLEFLFVPSVSDDTGRTVKSRPAQKTPSTPKKRTAA